MILVTGATGNAGGAVARALIDAGEEVRGLVREGATTSTVPAGVEAAIGDLDRPETVTPHLGGVTAAFMLSGYEGLDATLADMRKAGVERVVLLSSSAAPTADLTNAIARYHILSEAAVRGSGLRWTLLRPNSFMSNAYRWRHSYGWATWSGCPSPRCRSP
ncbi:MAG: SDR family oxidoreductase [Acidimicrobiales bacterium]